MDVKINASFLLQGRGLPAEPHLLKNVKKKKKKEKEEEKEKQKDEILYRQENVNLKGGKQIVISLREAKPARQNLHLNTEAYNYMTSNDNPVPKMKVFQWKQLSKNKKVKLHLQVIAESLGGKLESFTILED